MISFLLYFKIYFVLFFELRTYLFLFSFFLMKMFSIVKLLLLITLNMLHRFCYAVYLLFLKNVILKCVISVNIYHTKIRRLSNPEIINYKNIPIKLLNF